MVNQILQVAKMIIRLNNIINRFECRIQPTCGDLNDDRSAGLRSPHIVET